MSNKKEVKRIREDIPLMHFNLITITSFRSYQLAISIIQFRIGCLITMLTVEGNGSLPKRSVRIVAINVSLSVHGRLSANLKINK